MKPNKQAIAKQYYKCNTGTLHLSWLMDSYWGLMTKNLILPTALNIHKALVAKGLTKKAKREFNDLDDSIFYVPSRSGKAFVHTTQNRDFLYVIGRNDKSLHIRRIYRSWVRGGMYTAREMIGNMKLALQRADTLTDYADDHYQFSHRPSLEAYRKIDFQIPYHPVDHLKEKSYYGDFRDGGYILSYDGFFGDDPRVEGSKYSFAELDLIAGCYLPSLAGELEVDCPTKE